MRTILLMFARITFLIMTCCAPIFAQELIPYRCVDADDLFSSGEKACTITFENKLNRKVSINWIDESGANIAYATLSEGGNYTQATFISHKWLIADEQGNCLMVFVATAQNQEAIIREKVAKWNEIPPREDLEPIPCDGESSNRSINGDIPTGIYFINKTNQHLKTYWLNYEGKRVFYNAMEPKSAYKQPTYLTHPWVITDENEQCVCLFSPKTGAGNAIIDDTFFEKTVVDKNNFSGKVLNEKTEDPLVAFVTIIRQGSTDTVRVKTSVNGTFKASLAPGVYRFMIFNRDFFRLSQEIKIDLNTPESIFYLKQIVIIETMVIENVYFAQGQSVILPQSYKSLDKLYMVLVDNPIRIQIEGHTDNQGNSNLNLRLSEDRALAVKKYFVDKGIDAKRISTKGFGGTKPVASNEKEETRKQNRRVEFRIVE